MHNSSIHLPKCDIECTNYVLQEDISVKEGLCKHFCSAILGNVLNSRALHCYEVSNNSGFVAMNLVPDVVPQNFLYLNIVFNLSLFVKKSKLCPILFS